MPIVVLLVILLVILVLGGFIVGLTLKLLGWIIAGLVIGALARLLVPGTSGMSWISTILYGVAGSLVGGIVANALDVGAILQFLIAIATAAILIALFAVAAPRRELRA